MLIQVSVNVIIIVVVVVTGSGSAFGTWDGDLSFDLTAVKFMKLCGHSFCCVSVIVSDEAETTWMTSDPVAHDNAV